MDLRPIIAQRMAGNEHGEEALRALVRAATDATASDPQLAAWLMAAVLKPLSLADTAALTLAMADSGERLDLSSLPKPWIDKHSTGGVGDKTTLVLLPLLAACGFTVVKMSGRGLGITGGTVDKVESIPGFRTDFTPAELLDQAKRIGIAWSGQTVNLAPADKVLYALRDHTGTVESIPLIASSILSKKLAGGADTVLLDVKCGSGAFMHTLAEAEALAETLQAVGERCGLRVLYAITDMDQPLGRAVGNALEIVEAIEALSGKPSPVLELAITLAEAVAGAQAREAILSGRALAKFREWVEAQEGDVRCIDDPIRLPKAPVQREVLAAASGWVQEVNARIVGEVVMDLGAGRKQKGDAIDHAVGVEVLCRIGDRVEANDPVFRVHARTPAACEAACERLLQAIHLSPEPVAPRQLVLVSRL